ncbi:MAG: D-alanyl-D-alanine carboxypeptidase/D-alanyl-D-alanine endopeptidase [Pseudonocardia sp.]
MGFGHRIGDTLRLTGRGLRRLVLVLVVLSLAAGLGTTVALTAPSLLTKLGLPVIGGAEPPPTQLRPGLVPLGSSAPTPTGPGVAAVLDRLIAAGGLGRFGGTVLDADTGQVLWSRDESRALVPGSTAKLLTGAAALLALPPTQRLSTRVVAGPTPDSVVLIGAGDPTLSALPTGKVSVYPGAPRLDALADAVRAASAMPVKTVLYDVSRYTGDALASGWLPADVPGGFVAPIVPTMLDGGRIDPTEQDGSRLAMPARAVAQGLAQRLGAATDTVNLGTAPAGAAVLGEVTSVPVSELVEQMLRNSDNVLAEVLAREVAVARGGEGSFAGGARAVLDVLTKAGFDVGGVVISDGSGLSTLDQMPARLLAQLLAAAAGPSRGPEQGAQLRVLAAGLPVAGGDGTLDDRFAAGPTVAGRGFVRAKTGTLNGVTSLAGLVSTADGRLLVFALMSNGASPAEARPRLDAMATALHNCGCR